MRALSVAMAAVIFIALLARAWGSPADLTMRLVGQPSVLYDSQRDACAPIDVPDVNPRAYRDAEGDIVMFALHYVNRPLRGPDLTHVKIDCHVALDSALDADPARYDDRRYITATWTSDGTHVSALVHHEYHADTHGNCQVKDTLGCWFNTILAFHSNDGGAHFEPASPRVVASAPFPQSVEQGRHRGFFNPSNIFADGAYRYAFISTTGWDGQPPGNCLFRSPRAMDPPDWRAFDGTSFSVRYDDPYRSHARPKRCMMIEPFLFPVGSLVRHRPSGLWIAVFQAHAGGVYPVDGFYYATGRDLLHWSTPRLLVAGGTAYDDLCTIGPSIINYPALLDPKSSSRNFDTIGNNPLLFFARIGVENCQTTRRLLVYQPVALEVAPR